jgi:hypothetical protein
MQQHDEVVSGWLNGANSISGFENPAGPLYIDSATEKKMSSTNHGAVQTVLKTTQSCASGCACC